MMTPLLILVAWILAADTAPVDAFEPQPEDSELYADSYSFVVDLEDGAYLHAQIIVSNIGWGDRNAVCKLLFIDPKTSLKLREEERFDEDQWNYARIPSKALSVGPCRITHGDSVLLDVAMGEITVALSFEAGLLPGRRTTETLVRVDDASYRHEVLIPRSEVTGMLAIESQTPRSMSGFGFVDHSRSTVKPWHVARGWIRFRGLRPESPLLLLARYPADRSEASGWIWPLGSDPAAIDVVTRKSRAEGWQVSIRASEQRWVIDSTILLHRAAPVEDRGLLGAALEPFIGNPVTYTYRATLRDPSGGLTRGILEVSFADADD